MVHAFPNHVFFPLFGFFVLFKGLLFIQIQNHHYRPAIYLKAQLSVEEYSSTWTEWAVPTLCLIYFSNNVAFCCYGLHTTVKVRKKWLFASHLSHICHIPYATAYWLLLLQTFNVVAMQKEETKNTIVRCLWRTAKFRVPVARSGFDPSPYAQGTNSWAAHQMTNAHPKRAVATHWNELWDDNSNSVKKYIFLKSKQSSGYLSGIFLLCARK